jgi:hypothetical protein
MVPMKLYRNGLDFSKRQKSGEAPGELPARPLENQGKNEETQDSTSNLE